MALDDFNGEPHKHHNEDLRNVAQPGNPYPVIRKRSIYPIQTFDKTGEITSEDIIDEITRFNINWTKQFSRRRIEPGEIVYYSTLPYDYRDQIGLMVFTSIQSSTLMLYEDQELPIILAPWDLVEGKPAGYWEYVEHDSDWREKLHTVLGKMIQKLSDYMYFCSECDSPMVSQSYYLQAEPEYICKDNQCETRVPHPE